MIFSLNQTILDLQMKISAPQNQDYALNDVVEVFIRRIVNCVVACKNIIEFSIYCYKNRGSIHETNTTE